MRDLLSVVILVLQTDRNQIFVGVSSALVINNHIDLHLCDIIFDCHGKAWLIDRAFRRNVSGIL
jgi:hypothetical protein